MNNMIMRFTKDSGVYPINKNIKKYKKTEYYTDHPILIYQMNIPISLIEEYEEITTFDIKYFISKGLRNL